MSTLLHASVREVRLTLERIFLAAGVPQGMVTAVREHALVSAALGLAGFAHVEAAHAAIAASARANVRIVAERADGTLLVDAGGQHAWVAGATLLDLAVAVACEQGACRLVARGVAEPAELAVLEALAPRHAMRATVVGAPAHAAREDVAAGQSGFELRVTPQPAATSPEERDPTLWRALQHGIAVDEALWWRLHALGNRALAPDSIESRRHAGPIIVADDGRIIGRPVDDDTDFTLLRQQTA